MNRANPDEIYCLPFYSSEALTEVLVDNVATPLTTTSDVRLRLMDGNRTGASSYERPPITEPTYQSSSTNIIC